MLTQKIKQKYALSDNGISNIKRGTFWTVIVNLIVMGGMGILYFLMDSYMKTKITGVKLPPPYFFIAATSGFFILSFITHLQQYHCTYGLVYHEVKTVRISLAERLRKLPLSFFGKRDLADLTETIMSDVNRMEHVWSHVLGYMYGSYISTIIIAAALYACDWRLATATLWGVPVAFILLFGTRKIAERNSQKTKAASLCVSDGMQETLETIREIHATNKEERYLNELNKKIDRQEKLMIHGELVTGIFVNAASVIMRLGVATTVLVGAKLILSESISFMTLFMFLLVITRIYAPFDQSLALIAEVFLSEVSASRLMEIHNTKTADGSNTFKPENHDISFENVSFSYNDEKTLDGVTFTAKEGQVTALVGPSGSGKSTCARLAARLWDADNGSIKVGGIDISTVEPETLLTDYAMVFQDVVLFDDTVMENIRLGKHGATDQEVLEAAKAANCDAFVSKLPDGYQTKIGENGTKLSGGERQRISIARALLKNAPILLLDEATASLDVENETEVQAALSRLLKEKTVLVIAHRLRTVAAADKIVVLKDGKVCEEGSPEDLQKNKDSVFAKMLELQTKEESWTV
ncbi:ABC transporter ATP-binding protein [Treponema sp.]|uniref:ABC transporter ATP-binding protein n=1 Tax=Treponema sp. TaxID=166 RepID=UPI0025801DB2|nr:ABC transporter ATP-binding protein [Treponema sp.]MBE6355104.1 ABC transporter ATP-binding protein [Treponema sp.]